VQRVPRLQRAIFSLACGLLAGMITIQKNAREPTPRDFEQVWFAARSLVDGLNPYPRVGPGLAFDWPFPLLYPLPAAVIGVPFAPFPAQTATVLFSILGGAALAWALMAYGYGPLFGFFSMPVRAAFESVQWGPLLSAATVIAPLGLFLVAKPTVGGAIFLSRPSRWAFIGALVFGGAAFAVQPGWVADWLDAIARDNAIWAPTVPYRAPITFIGGPLVLLCLLRWRRPEARLVAALVCVPQTLVWYEAVPLMLVPRTFWQSVALVGIGYVGHTWVRLHLPPVFHERLSYQLVGQAMIWSLYLPCTLMVLRRPNEGWLPPWVERRIAHWPAWLRGIPGLPDSRAAAP
jgi:hypothetical protein